MTSSERPSNEIRPTNELLMSQENSEDSCGSGKQSHKCASIIKGIGGKLIIFSVDFCTVCALHLPGGGTAIDAYRQKCVSDRALFGCFEELSSVKCAINGK